MNKRQRLHEYQIPRYLSKLGSWGRMQMQNARHDQTTAIITVYLLPRSHSYHRSSLWSKRTNPNRNLHHCHIHSYLTYYHLPVRLPSVTRSQTSTMVSGIHTNSILITPHWTPKQRTSKGKIEGQQTSHKWQFPNKASSQTGYNLKQATKASHPKQTPK